jgi:hypothetical protein
MAVELCGIQLTVQMLELEFELDVEGRVHDGV